MNRVKILTKIKSDGYNNHLQKMKIKHLLPAMWGLKAISENGGYSSVPDLSIVEEG
jgi:hypothetical protein